MNKAGWVGIDLDGTLAKYDSWRGVSHIGEPIPAMVDYVKGLLDAGIEIRIFTARCQAGAKAMLAIELWCKVHLGRVLQVTDKKDFGMVFCVDDRAVSVIPNTGIFAVQPPDTEVIKQHWAAKGAPDAAEHKRD